MLVNNINRIDDHDGTAVCSQGGVLGSSATTPLYCADLCKGEECMCTTLYDTEWVNVVVIYWKAMQFPLRLGIQIIIQKLDGDCNVNGIVNGELIILPKGIEVHCWGGWGQTDTIG